jgi:hypothetical protein
MSLPFHPKAEREQERAFRRYERIHPQLAVRFAEILDAVLSRIEGAIRIRFRWLKMPGYAMLYASQLCGRSLFALCIGAVQVLVRW